MEGLGGGESRVQGALKELMGSQGVLVRLEGPVGQAAPVVLGAPVEWVGASP